MHELQTINFHDDTIFMVEHNNEPFTPVRPICENIGLDWSRQRKKITKQPERWKYGLMPTIANDGKQRQMFCLPLRKLNGWLLTISPSKVKPEIKGRLIQYQNECDEALWDYWTKGTAVNPRTSTSVPVKKSVGIFSKEFREMERSLVIAAQDNAYRDVHKTMVYMEKHGVSFEEVEQYSVLRSITMLTKKETKDVMGVTQAKVRVIDKVVKDIGIRIPDVRINKKRKIYRRFIDNLITEGNMPYHGSNNPFKTLYKASL